MYIYIYIYVCIYLYMYIYYWEYLYLFIYLESSFVLFSFYMCLHVWGFDLHTPVVISYPTLWGEDTDETRENPIVLSDWIFNHVLESTQSMPPLLMMRGSHMCSHAVPWRDALMRRTTQTSVCLCISNRHDPRIVSHVYQWLTGGASKISTSSHDSLMVLWDSV